MARKKTSAPADEAREADLEGEDEPLERYKLIEELAKLEDERDAARAYNAELAAEKKEIEAEAARLEAVVGELQGQLTSVGKAGAAQAGADWDAGWKAGYAAAMAEADKSPAAVKRAVHGDGPVRVRIARKSAFFTRAQIAEMPENMNAVMIIEGSVKIFREAGPFSVAGWDVVAAKTGQIDVV